MNDIFFALWSLCFWWCLSSEMPKNTSNGLNNIGKLLLKPVKVQIDIEITNHRALNFQEWNRTKTAINFHWHHRRVSGLEGHRWCPARPAHAGPRWRVRRWGVRPLVSCFPKSGLPYFPSWGLLRSHWMSFLCQSKNTYIFKSFRPSGLLRFSNGKRGINISKWLRGVEYRNIPRLECCY